MIFTVISILIALYGCINFKKSIMLFTIYQIFWYSTEVFSFGNIGFNANFVIPFWFFILYMLNRNKHKKCTTEFPLKIPFLLIIISYIFSCFTAISGFTVEFFRALMKIFSIYIFIWILWNTIDDKSDFKFLFKGTTVIILFACIYGICEYITQKNFILDYKVLLSNNTINIYNTVSLRGYRLTSFFEHPLGAGMTLGLFAIFYFSLWLRDVPEVTKSKLGLITAIICFPCIIFTKMRTGIIFTLISGMMLFNIHGIKKKTFYNVVILIIVLSPIIFFIIKTNSTLFTNLITSEMSEDIGGSSLSMRLDQFTAIKNIAANSSIFGLGETFRSYISQNDLTKAALGYEGIIFEQIAMHGYFGIFVNIVFCYYTIFVIPKRYKSKEIFFFSLAYWVSYLVSSIPSFRIVLFYLAIFYYIKSSPEYQNKKRVGEKEKKS